MFLWELSAKDLATIEAVWASAGQSKAWQGMGGKFGKEWVKALRGGEKSSVHVIRGSPVLRFQQIGNYSQKLCHFLREPSSREETRGAKGSGQKGIGRD
jgi:hypothetical protein